MATTPLEPIGYVGPHPVVEAVTPRRGRLCIPYNRSDRAVIVRIGGYYMLTHTACGHFDARNRVFRIEDAATYRAAYPAAGRGAAECPELLAALQTAAPFDPAFAGAVAVPSSALDFDIVAGDFDRVPMKLKLGLVTAAAQSMAAFTATLDAALSARPSHNKGWHVYRFEDVGLVSDVMLRTGRALVVFDADDDSVLCATADFYGITVAWPGTVVAHDGGSVLVKVVGFGDYESSTLPKGTTFAELATDVFSSTHTVHFYSRGGPVSMSDVVTETTVFAVRVPRAATVRRITALQVVRECSLSIAALYKYYRALSDAQQPPGAAIGGSGILELPPCLTISQNGKNVHRKMIAQVLHHSGIGSGLQGMKLRDFKEGTAPRLVGIAGETKEDTRRFNQMLGFLHWFTQQGGGGNGGPTCHGNAYCPYRDQMACKFRAVNPYIATAIKIINGSAAPKRYNACDTCNPARGNPNSAVIRCTDPQCPSGNAQCAACFLSGKPCLGCNALSRGSTTFRVLPRRRNRTVSFTDPEPKRVCVEPKPVVVRINGVEHSVSGWGAIVWGVGSSTARFYGFGDLVPVGDGIPVCECVFRSQHVPTLMWNAFAERNTEPAILTAPERCGRCGEA